MKAPPSPDSLQLRGAPSSSARLSRKAAFVAAVILGLILAVILVNVSKEQDQQGADDVSKVPELAPALNEAKSLTQDIPDVLAPPVLPSSQAPVLPPPVAPGEQAPAKTAEDEARLADTSIPKFDLGEVAAVRQGSAGESDSEGDDAGPESSSDRESSAAEPDLNRQDKKLAFQAKIRRTAYLKNALTPPVSPFEMKTGTVIPSVLIGAVNSDLPGEIVAQVSQNVYDTARGEHVLIPQGTRLYGRYDSNVTFGQGRLLVNWQRLIFPNAHTLELDGMSGHDAAGSAGFADRVNNHYGRIFGWGLLTSVFSAGFQLSQPQRDNVLTTPSNGEVAAAAVGQEVTQLGVAIARRNMQIQPTIEIRKGYRFNVMVNKDIVFPGAYAP